MIQSVGEWNPFDTLLARSSDQEARPDLAFAMETRFRPVLGMCVAPPQLEYGDRQRHDRANKLLRSVARAIDAAVIPIDTGWPAAMNATGLESEAQIESVIGKVDALLTTRVHGTVYALKRGVPPLVIDPIMGGDKVISQARTVGWPEAHLVGDITRKRLVEGIAYCLSEPGRARARECASKMPQRLEEIHGKFIEALSQDTNGGGTEWPARHVVRRSVWQRVRGVLRRHVRRFGRVLASFDGKCGQ